MDKLLEMMTNAVAMQSASADLGYTFRGKTPFRSTSCNVQLYFADDCGKISPMANPELVYIMDVF